MSDAAAESRRRDGEGSGETRTTQTSDGREVAYAEYGSPAGSPVVCFHGTPGSRVLGELFDGTASERGVRLLAIDRPGYGRSDGWSARELGDTGKFVSPVLVDAGVSSAGVVGFSGGGPHALALAATRPDLVEDVDVVAGSPAPSLVEEPPRVHRVLEFVSRTAPRLLRGLVRGQAWFAARTSPALVVSQYTSSGGAGDVPDAAADVVRRDFVEGVAGRGEGLVTESRLLAEEWDFDLGGIDVEVRLWHGDDDANAPLDGARRLTAELPDAELTVLSDTDHLNTLLDAREQVLERHGE